MQQTTGTDACMAGNICWTKQASNGRDLSVFPALLDPSNSTPGNYEKEIISNVKHRSNVQAYSLQGCL